MTAGLTALVLAGSRGSADPMAQAAHVAHKALIPIAGRPMIAHVLGALRAVPAIGRIAVSAGGHGALAALAKGCEILTAEPGPSQSVAAAIEKLGTPLLVTTADHALLRPEWVTYFLTHCRNADIIAAVARSETVLAAVPDAKRTFLRFSDGRFSGCNLFYLANGRAKNAVRFWQKMEAHRKHPLKLLAQLGVLTAAQYATGTLALPQALERLSKLADARAGIVEMPDGLAAVDVDRPGDLALVRKILESDRHF